MPPQTLYALTAEDLRLIRWLLSKVRTQLPTLEGQFRPQPQPMPPTLNWVRLLASTTTNSRYPGVLTYRDVAGQAWHDFDATTETLFTGNTTNGSKVVTSCSTTSGFAAGDDVTGSGIPAGATIASVDSSSQLTLSEAATATATGVVLTESAGQGEFLQEKFTGNTTNNGASITSILDTTGWTVGDPITGSGIPADAVITSVDSSSQVTLSAKATATASGVSLTRSHCIWVEAANGETLADSKHYLGRYGDDDGNGTGVYTASPGIGTAFSGARVYNSADQTFTTGSSGGTLSFNNKRYDTDSYWSNSHATRLTAPKTGVYRFGASIRLYDANLTNNTVLGTSLSINGTNYVAADSTVSYNRTGDSFSGVGDVNVTTTYSLTAGDYVEVNVASGDTGVLWALSSQIGSAAGRPTIGTGAYSPEFWIEFVG